MFKSSGMIEIYDADAIDASAHVKLFTDYSIFTNVKKLTILNRRVYVVYYDDFMVRKYDESDMENIETNKIIEPYLLETHEVWCKYESTDIDTETQVYNL
jgi:hypothetical protein